MDMSSLFTVTQSDWYWWILYTNTIWNTFLHFLSSLSTFLFLLQGKRNTCETYVHIYKEQIRLFVNHCEIDSPNSQYHHLTDDMIYVIHISHYSQCSSTQTRENSVFCWLNRLSTCKYIYFTSRCDDALYVYILMKRRYYYSLFTFCYLFFFLWHNSFGISDSG